MGWRFVVWGLGLLVVPCLLLFKRIGRPDLTMPTGAVVAAIAGAVWANWDRRGRKWFWYLTAALGALHALVIAWVRWPRVWIPTVVLVPIVLADVAVMTVIFGLIERWTDAGSAGPH